MEGSEGCLYCIVTFHISCLGNSITFLSFPGSVYHKYPEKKSVRKGVKGACIPEKEEQLTSREWMRLYSLNRMKLDLNKIVAGPDCKHSDSPVKTLNRRVEAK